LGTNRFDEAGNISVQIPPAFYGPLKILCFMPPCSVLSRVQNQAFERGLTVTALFHLAYNVTDLDETRAFYGALLGCREGRSTESWVDFDFFGHQISLHLGKPFETANTGKVGEHMVPMPHLGIVLPMEEWKTLASRLEEEDLDFVLKPQIRFPGEPGEQATMFFRDPSGNPIEVKGFRDLEGVYAS
jgi:hypothetical protein